jgi:hypothetical protein
MTLVVLGVEVLAIPTGWEGDLGPDLLAVLLGQFVALRGRNAICFQAVMGDGQVLNIALIERSARRIGQLISAYTNTEQA